MAARAAVGSQEGVAPGISRMVGASGPREENQKEEAGGRAGVFKG